MRWSRWILVGLLMFLAATALYGGALLMLDPSGRLLDLSVRALQESPFRDYFVPGTILFVVLGIGAGIAAVATLARVPWAPYASAAIGFGLIFWLAAQGAMIAFGNPLQLGYLTVGIAIAALAAAVVDFPSRRQP
jgi:hypothetical protein